jgi:hypothetical protein
MTGRLDTAASTAAPAGEPGASRSRPIADLVSSIWIMSTPSASSARASAFSNSPKAMTSFSKMN